VRREEEILRFRDHPCRPSLPSSLAFFFGLGLLLFLAFSEFLQFRVFVFLVFPFSDRLH